MEPEPEPGTGTGTRNPRTGGSHKLTWFRSAQKRLGDHTEAAGNRPRAGVSVDVDETDAVGHVERVIGAAGERPLHERQPDGEGRLRAAQAERLVVVEPDPDHGQQLRRESHEPCVSKIVRGAGFPGGVEVESGCAHGGAGAFAEHAPHHVRHEVGRIGPRDTRDGRLLRHDLCRPALDPKQRTQRALLTRVAEDGIRRRDVERCGFEYPERNGWKRAWRRTGANTPPEISHTVVPGGFSHFYRRRIARQREGTAEGDLAIVLILIVRRRPRRSVCVERRRFVVHESGRRQCRAVGCGPLEGGKEHERLEDRARLTARADGPVVLRLVVRAPADHRENIAGARIDRDQRGLRDASAAPSRQ